jgi:hypothetical protein
MWALHTNNYSAFETLCFGLSNLDNYLFLAVLHASYEPTRFGQLRVQPYVTYQKTLDDLWVDGYRIKIIFDDFTVENTIHCLR